MTRKFFSKPFAVYAVLATVAVACATSPTGRKQLIVLPDSQMDQLGAQSFDQMKQQQPTTNDPRYVNYVKCITGPITDQARGMTPVEKWETVVFKDDSANAFALPGGKIGVHTGIIPVAKTDAQLAAVLGHEVGHVIARHGSERMSQGMVAQIGMVGTQAALGNSATSGPILAALGLGTQVGILLPFGRTQESEADQIGLDLMAKAGFDPRQAVELWKNMAAASGGKSPPEFLSTHPSSATRIKDIEAHLPKAMEFYKKAQAEGRKPYCKF